MKKVKSLRLMVLMIAVFCCFLLTSCKDNTDYTPYFSIQNIAPFVDDDDPSKNLIQVEYQIKNLGKKDDMIFSVAVSDDNESYSVAPGEETTDSVMIDIGRPDNFALEYPVQYQVYKDGELVWSKDDVVQYDCTEMFRHQCTIEYGDDSTQVEVKDYQSNYFDLAELFPSFDASEPHSVDTYDAGQGCAEITIAEGNDDGKQEMASGSILHLYTIGNHEINDSYRYADDFVVKIADVTPASSVENWADLVSFRDTANIGTIQGISLMTLYIDIDNPSDEPVYASIPEFYVNDIQVDSNMHVAVGYGDIAPSEIDAKESGEAWIKTSAPVIRATTSASINKFGARLQLKDGAGNLLYDDILWKVLE